MRERTASELRFKGLRAYLGGAEDKEVQWGYCSKDWPTNAKLMHDAGIDSYAVWIARTRERGASPWVSMRMNDNHDGWLPHGARVSDFYKKHPEWRMSPDYRGGQWWPYALDFVHQGR